AGQVGRDRADQGIGLSDGGQGREEFFKVPFPRATLIVDFSPAAGHLADLAQAWSDDTVTAAALLEAWRPPRKDEGGAAVVRPWDAVGRRGQGFGVSSARPVPKRVKPVRSVLEPEPQLTLKQA